MTEKKNQEVRPDTADNPTSDHAPSHVSESAVLPQSRFTVLAHHAQGGLGVVSRARDERLGREVALKEIRPEHQGSDYLRKRFLNEAEITGQLEHPGIVPIYALEEGDNGNLFYAMRFIEGETFQNAIRQYHKDPGPLGHRDLLQRFVTVCRTMAYAHDQGVIHRDLKPENVMVGAYGETLVVDWGLAKRLGSESEPLTPDEQADQGTVVDAQGTVDFVPQNTPEITQAGQVIGTPAFMSPEQAAGDLDLLGPGTDIYALGAILYQILTGRVPYSGGSSREIIDKVLSQSPVPPVRAKRNVPKALSAVCMKAMERTVFDRYSTAGDLADEIEQYLADEPVEAYREPWHLRARRWSRRHRALVTGTVASLLVGVISLIVASVLLLQANDREREARARADDNLDVATSSIFSTIDEVANDPELKKQDLHPLRKRLLAPSVKFLKKIVKQKSNDPDLEMGRVRAYLRLVTVRREMGELQTALKEQTEAIALLRDILRRFPSVQKAARNYPVSLLNLGKLHLDLHDYAKAEELFQDARTELNRLFSQGDAEARRVMASIQMAFGKLYFKTNKRAKATEAYRDASEILTKLLATEPEDEIKREMLALTYLNAGSVLSDSKVDADNASNFYSKAIDQFQLLLQEDPGNPKYQYAVGGACINLGIWHQERGESRKAQIMYQRALPQFEALVKRFSNVPTYRAGLAQSQGFVATGLILNGNVKEGLMKYEHAAELWIGLRDEHPGLITYRQELGTLYHETAKAMATQKQLDKAAALYGKAIHERRQPQLLTSSRSKANLAQSLHNLATIQLDQGDLAAAAKSAIEALTLRGKVLATTPNEPRPLIDIIWSHLQLAAVANKKENWPEVIEQMEKAVRRKNELAKREEMALPELTSLGWLTHNIALEFQRQRKHQEAAREFEHAIAIRKTMLKTDPDFAEHQSHLAWSYLGHVKALVQLRRPKEALTVFKMLEAILEKLVSDYPNEWDYSHRLAQAHIETVDAHRQLSEWTNQAGAFHAAHKIWRELIPKSNDPEHRRALGQSLHNLGIHYRQRNKIAESITAYQKALPIRTNLVKENPQNNGHRANLAWTATNLAEIQFSQRRYNEEMELQRLAREQRTWLVEQNPNHAEYRQQLRYTLQRFLSMYQRMRKMSEIPGIFNEQYALMQRTAREKPADRANLTQMAINRSDCMALTLGLKQPQAAAKAAMELMDARIDQNLYCRRAAGGLVKCAALVRAGELEQNEKAVLVEKHESTAVLALKKAIKHGAKPSAILRNRDYKPLHDREDFKDLMKSVGQ